MKSFNPPGERMFTLWRTVFALVHVDGYLDEEERVYIEQIMDRFSFLPEQRAIVETGLDEPADVQALFAEIEGEERRRQFFRLARMIIWCDGLLHDDEREILQNIWDSLGEDEANLYANEWRWLFRKPDTSSYEEAGDGQSQEALIEAVAAEMEAFYRARGSE